MVATPIGNLADISLRALHVLDLVDVVACEDTRHTRQLLLAYGIDKQSAQLLALHQHNEREAAQQVLQLLQAGKRVAYVSDAGTPGVSDPGALLVQVVQQAGLRTIPLPGASSVTSMLSVAALDGADASAYVFAGFLPAKGRAREAAVAALAREPRAVVLLEAPHRITELARALAVLGCRQITIGRELTKQFEQIHSLPAQELAGWLAADAQRTRGEFVVVLHPAVQAGPGEAGEGAAAQRLLQALLAESVSLKSAVRVVADFTGLSRNVLYQQALALSQSEQHQADD